MRLQTLLQTPSMQHMRVIAGERGLKREISNIGMIESPDIADFAQVYAEDYHNQQVLKH